MRKQLVAAALVAAVAVLVVVSLPPAHLALATTFSDGTVPGIIHVHTNRSDGRGTPDEVAVAAARAGLKFVVFTDHGDATRTPDPPVYRSGVLCLDAVEISTTDGHYLALDMPVAPYPLGGEARDVVEDVKRLGGFGIVAHPESPKPALAWRAWDAPFDGIEWVNPDTSWRVRVGQRGWRARWSVIAALAAYPFRPEDTIARLLGGTTLRADRWHSLTRKRRIVALAGADAHANLALGNADPAGAGPSLAFPGYEVSFRTLSVHVQPERPLSGNAGADGAAIMQALRHGHAYVAIDGLATPAAFQFTATNAREAVGQGDELAADGPVTLRVRSNAPPSFTTVIWENDRVLASVQSQMELTRLVRGPGVYRVEIDAPSEGGPIPWVIGNPIHVGVSYPPAMAPSDRPAVATRTLFDGSSAGWSIESDATSAATLDVAPGTSGAELRMRYGLSGGPSSGQYVALVVDTPAGDQYNRLALTLRSDRPLRLSVQLRAPGRDGDRWRRSVYVDQADRRYTIDFDDMTPIAPARAPHPPPSAVRTMMLVIDTIHAKPGSSGRLWIREASLHR